MVLHGIFGPQISPKNLSTVLTWVHFRGVLILVLLVAGNFFCMACPFMLVRNAGRRLFKPRWNWPRALRNKWGGILLFAGVLFAYENFSLWSRPLWTAWLTAGYFGIALLVDGLFEHATFCKYLCPIGQFNFIASTVSPLEVAVRDHGVCDRCQTKDCIRGRRAAGPGAEKFVILQRGCETALFQPRKEGNVDCTFCLDCVHACPHDNVGILSREPVAELSSNALRSGIGRFSRRVDLAALAVFFVFSALMNALGMVAPVYSMEKWLGSVLRTEWQPLLLGLVFVAVIVLLPAVLLLPAAAVSSRVSARNWREMLLRYSYSLVPVGFGMWLSHYSFHFLTGLLTVIPVTQSALNDIGIYAFGDPMWTLMGLPLRWVQPLQMGALVMGFAGSLIVSWRLAEEDAEDRVAAIFAPWAAVDVVLLVIAVWLMLQPMDMRATLMAG